MEQNLREVFRKAKYEPDADLVPHTWSAITLHEKRKTELKLWAFSFIGCASLLALIPAALMLARDVAKSGFYEYMSLAFSIPSIASYWRELAFSLAESLPILSITLSLGLVFLVCLSARHVMRQIGRNESLISL